MILNRDSYLRTMIECNTHSGLSKYALGKSRNIHIRFWRWMRVSVQWMRNETIFPMLVRGGFLFFEGAWVGTIWLRRSAWSDINYPNVCNLQWVSANGQPSIYSQKLRVSKPNLKLHVLEWPNKRKNPIFPIEDEFGKTSLLIVNLQFEEEMRKLKL